MRCRLPTLKVSVEDMFSEFQYWCATAGATRHETNKLKYARKMSLLVYDPEKSRGLKGFSKVRDSKGMSYSLDIAQVKQEMVEKRWVTQEEVDAPL